MADGAVVGTAVGRLVGRLVGTADGGVVFGENDLQAVGPDAVDKKILVPEGN